ncbi:SRPBCC domain-containing protein [Agromyces sp. LHK192]|uniref:SRPBCC family protein n=1 Tax=Agromyces sp. LHK192 TaxID=2498704 RepID=UPI000FD9847C|nr:SRPBCC domain-containing protein [Agromyces sp. LHK192]
MSERNATAQFTITRIFDAPRDLVWAAWTTSADAAEWWHPAGITIKPGSVDVDAREGGRYDYTMVDPEGREYPTAGEYREVSPPERLVFTWGSPGESDAPVITVTLRDLDGERTEMLFHVLGVDAQPGDDDVHDGWSSAFDMLEGHLGTRVA